MTKLCQHCGQPLNEKRANAKYCSQRCWRAAFAAAPAEVQRIVQGKRGWWTVTIRCARQRHLRCMQAACLVNTTMLLGLQAKVRDWIKAGVVTVVP